MSPIIDLQRRLREAGRIRLGEKVETRDGKLRPAKLAQFRITCPDELTIRTIAAVYGGEPRPWDGAPVGEQWELYTEATALDVIVPPVDVAWSQFFENWSGGVCRNRCDGVTDWKNDTICSCDMDSPACKPTSRLGVILTAIDGIGIFRLETHGWNGAQELNGAIEMLRIIQDRGQMVPARLLLEQRQQKKVGSDGKVQTLNFAVPVLDLRVNLAALTSAGQTPQLGAPSAAPSAVPYVTPIPTTAEDVEPPSVAEQMQAAKTPEPRRQTARSAAPLPATRVAPRTTAEASAQRTAGGASQPSMRRLFALLGGKGVKSDDERHKWASDVLDREVASFSELSQTDVTKLNDAVEGNTPPRVEYGPDDEPF